MSTIHNNRRNYKAANNLEKSTKELSSSQALLLSNPSNQIVPVNFGLKYRPPKLGLQYQIINNEATLSTTVKTVAPTFVHEISLHWVTSESDIDFVFNEVLSQNKQFLSPKLVAPAQVRRLIDRFINHLKENKENASANKMINQKGLKTTLSPMK